MYASQKQFQPDLAKKRREREEGRKGATMLTLINYKTKLMTKHINSRKAAGGCGFWILDFVLVSGGFIVCWGF